MVDSNSTRDLIGRAKSGDRAAYGSLIDRFSDRLTALVSSRIGPGLRDELDVEDVVQETFTRALEDLERFQWTGDDAFMRWLGSIAENRIRKGARKKGRSPRVEHILEIPKDETSPSRALQREERFERLEKALAKLPQDYREVIRLSRVEGLKIKEVAKRMGRSQNAVKQLVVRALRRLKEVFGDTESFHLPDRRLDAEK